MKIWRITPARYLPDLTRGPGGMYAAGRWHEKGVPILYAADHPSTALLEMIAAAGAARLRAGSYVVVPMVVPDGSQRTLETHELPSDWRRHPHPDSTRSIGMQWIQERRFLALNVPSAVFPTARNIVLDPRHPLMKEVVVDTPQPLDLDPRLTRTSS